MSGKPHVQDEYLNEVRTSKTPVEIVLLSGKSLRGVVEAFDTFTIRLRCKSDALLIFKSAIAVIGPIRENRGPDE
ncbi:MAG: RNA chaperone Hfq [Armatimonadota bacterium]|nr:RNA chaperone Hfq [Armatimonadota bacterium]